MRKKYTLLMGILGILMVLLFTGFAVWKSAGSKPEFPAGGFIIRENKEQFQRLEFRQGDDYAVTLAGQISFREAGGKNVVVPRENFAHMENDTTIAFSDGVLLDFNDLSENFINNYYIPAGMAIQDHSGTYTAQTTAGDLEFGEHIWKLTDRMYLVRARDLKVCFSADDVRDAGDMVQVYITDDSVVRIQTADEMWSTISPDCYIRTEKGVKIYPVALLVDNGTYKLSMAKLAVSTDDAVVLTEAETRRQIVPELNIEAIDGEDGEDGVQGVAGAAGENGTAGNEGTDGKGGVTGDTGKDGLTGGGGGKGEAGKDAVQESSSYNAIPTMSITEWNLSATKLEGTLRIVDSSELLDSEKSDKYPGKVTLTNTVTGEVILCYPVTIDPLSGRPVISSDPNFGFSGGSEADDAGYAAFSTGDGVLEPDTEYKLSVSGYYHTDAPPMTYQREFLSRTFTTDSTGVSMQYSKATVDSITISASVDAGVTSVKFFLLDKAQNDSITAAAVESGNGLQYTDMIEWKAGDSTNDLTFDKDVQNGSNPLVSNKRYYVRAYVVNENGLHALSKQALEVMTLKTQPIYDSNQDPSATYNRTNGVFEVWRPSVTDVNGGVIKYVYTAYDSTGKSVLTREVYPGDKEPVEFAMETVNNATYTFGVTMEFHDNEKTSYYDLGTSDQVVASGDTLPHLTLVDNNGYPQYNAYKGFIRIPIGAKSQLVVDKNHRLELTIYNNQIKESVNSLELTEKEKQEYVNGLNDTLGTATLRGTSDATNIITNECFVDLDLINLYNNSNYAIAVTGYLDVGDGNGAVKRAIGTVTFRTTKTATLTAVWTPVDDGDDMLSVKVRICEDTAATVASYAMEELMKGQVTLALYRGSGARPQQIGVKHFVNETELSQLFGEGYEVKQSKDFQNANLAPNETYTLTLTSIVDGSCNLDLPYQNYFLDIVNPSKPLEAVPSPPDLRVDPQNAIKVGYILNQNVENYGGKEDKTLPKDAVVGFTLESDYDNKNRIGRSITYYAYEYQSMYNVLKSTITAGQDPLELQKPLLTMTESIDPGSDFAPKVAILFGGNEGEKLTGNYSGYQVYWSGVPGGAGTLSTGMGRGYRYIFAYTVEYEITTGTGENANTVTKTYPNDYRADEYDTFNRQFGGITLGTNTVGRGKPNCYLLNSDMVDVPNIMPELFTYLYDTEVGDPKGTTTASGKVELHYAWRDPEKLIKLDLGDNTTNIVYDPFVHNQETAEMKIAGEGGGTAIDKEGAALQWYKVFLPFEVYKGGEKTVLNPALDIAPYDISYEKMLDECGLTADPETHPLTSIPVDWPYKFTYSETASLDVKIDVTLDKNQNALKFQLLGSQSMELAKRAVGMRVTMSPNDEGVQKVFNIRLTRDGGSPTGKLPTSELGSEYLHKNAKIHKVEILYDSGVQGWKYAETTEDYFTLQYTNKDANGAAEYGGYHGNTLVEEMPASHAMLKTVNDHFTALGLRKTIAQKKEDDVKQTIHLRADLVANHSNAAYLYPVARGVDVSGNISTNTLSNRYEVAKQLASKTITHTPDHIRIEGMTPTMDKPNFPSNNVMIQATGFKVYGLEGRDTIYMIAYNDQLKAENLEEDGVVGKPVEIKLNTDGTPTATPTLEFTGPPKTYYIAFYYKNGSKNVLLRYGTNMEVAVFEASTSKGVVFTPNSLSYKNESYFVKTIDCKFSINRPQFTTLRCDVYDTDACLQETFTAAPVLNYETMLENKIITEGINATYNTGVSLSLRPSPARKALEPGKTYYLRIEARENSGVLAGFMVQPVEIPAVNTYGALIYTSSLIKNEKQEMEVTFQVTINDPQYSLMGVGRSDEESIEKGALYAVRFVDDQGKRLRTSYDNELYSAHALREEFVLSNDNLRSALNTSGNDADGNPLDDWNSIKEARNYTIQIYAAADPEHDGVIEVYNQKTGDTEEWTWEQMFIKTKDPVTGDEVYPMNTLIDSFWNMGTNDANYRKVNEAMRGTMNRMLISQKTQNTGSGSGIVMDEKNVYLSRPNSAQLHLTFRECFNLTKKHPQTGETMSTFQRVDYYITGTAGARPVEVSGTILGSDPKGGQQLIIKGEDAGGYPVYNMTMNIPLSEGYYQCTFHFYENENDETYAKTITKQLG